ncbi:PREDICTED: receptor-like protein kinase FERONIA [Erythranthe guttata]|uniref:receptor-like protein kinase FERONIA n=1 Tax=Erythranthe guttata TaxID=4155 RepID=UPI00064E052F|nr:PREDICTED: receptor-like protein kinase FERONIA [Erythranthe guttata]|eukprot:XP_012839990.1 PREDICTED: receptor-like protein kinase FERONIA [Erythranthe guttata]
MNLHPLLNVVLFLFILIKLTASISNPSHFAGDVLINCGSKGTSSADNGREWIGDVQPKSSSVLQMKGSSTISTVIPNLISSDPVPHETARISKTQFSYELHVSPGQKIIRLHFNPTSYKGFKGLDDLFTVETGPFTLLSNFSASLTAESLKVYYFAKEFCLNIQENQRLNMIFSPESGRSSDTYAFINGIEIFSVPPSISYFEGGYVGLQLVGEKYLVYFDYNTALEILHRVEIKQNPVQSDGNYDHMFPNRASRNANKINNTTWKMPVDVGFKYLIRVHLSELGLKIAGTGDNMFEVLINEMIAHTNMDVVNRRDENSIPWYRDYMVMVSGNKNEGKRDIMVSLKSHDDLIGAHAFFSGFEIFKLSNSDNSLASPNPLPLTRESPSHTVQTLFVLLFNRNAIATVAISIISFLCIVVHKLLKIQEANTDEEGNKPKPSVRAERLCRIFSLDEIQLATKNFSDTLVIGRGGFGKVYKGHIDKEQITVAIKRLKSSSKQGAHEFLTEIETLSELRHVNLVSLIGYCNEQREMILVYEYMPCGTLADHIYKLERENNTRSSLTWKQFLDICMGAGRGLDYLHTGHGVIHRDVKASNILLDENFIAKVSDFGLAKLENKRKLETHITTNVKGTFGYLDPNYYRTHKLTRKSDTYAFGVVLLEVLCRRPAVDLMVPQDERVLSVWARDKINKGEADQIVSISMRGEISPNCLKTFVGVAQRCLSDEPKNRPTMCQVVSQLELAFEQSLEIATTISNESSVRTGQPIVFSTAVQNFPLHPNEQTNSNVVIAQLPHDDKDDSLVQTRQPTIFSTAVQNFTLPPNEQTNSNVVIAQLPHDDKDGSSVQTGQPTVFSTAVQNFTLSSNEQTNSNVVTAQFPHDDKDGSSIQTRQPTFCSTAVA